MFSTPAPFALSLSKGKRGVFFRTLLGLVCLGICSCHEILEGFSMEHSPSSDPAQEISDLRGFQG